MMSLFSSFDLFVFNFTYYVFFTFSGSLMMFCWKTGSLPSFLHSLTPLHSFFCSLKSKSFNKSSLLFIITFTFMICTLNLFSVFPFTFPLTSSFGGVLFYSISFWLSFSLFSALMSTSKFLSHMIPEGSPLGLAIVLFLIEVTSMMIRPITLTVRLVANILAGHLLMVLLSNLVFYLSTAFFFYMVLNMVEIFVSLVQAYIFCTMISLYYSEIN